MSKWISVQERLPEPRDGMLAGRRISAYVLARDGNGWVAMARVRLGRVIFWMSSDEFLHTGRVTHWQPLPDDPEGKIAGT
jgi:hypothetical protein